MMTTEAVLVLGATGKTGSRVLKRLEARGVPVRAGTRSGGPPFDWNDRATWAGALANVGSAYLTYYPDLAVPGAAATVGALAELAVKSGVRKLVLLSGRGEEGALRGEQAVKASGADWTILRSSWFDQNFSEGFFREQVLAGEVFLPAGEVPEPFVDADDVADTAVAALTDDGHSGQLYELTGPRLLTFEEAIDEIARATGRRIRFAPMSSERYASLLTEAGVPADFVWLVNYLFTEVLDGRNASVKDGVRHALGREARDFTDYAWDTADAGLWSPVHAGR